MPGSREGNTVRADRLQAYDVARGVAFLGMVIVNYKIVPAGLRPDGPDWLMRFLTG